MYTNRRYTTRVRDGGARYGHGPVPAEPYPAARVLQDLAAASDARIPLILARYAALRAWLLTDAGGPSDVIRHARSAARAHIAEAGSGWAEGVHLAAALRARTTARALERLLAAAAEADTAGEVQGARAIREAVHRARWRRSHYPPPSPS